MGLASLSRVGHYLSAMKSVNAKGVVKIPDGVEVTVKSRNVVVKGKRGTLTKSFRHMSVDLYKPDEKTVKVEKWFASSKELAVIKTCCSHIQNMIDGVTKGFQYRMKMVYAHFPTNVQIASNGESLDVVNFIGQKVKFHVDCLDGVKVERDSQSTQRSSSTGTTSRMCRGHVLSSPNLVPLRTRISVSSLMVSMCPTRHSRMSRYGVFSFIVS